MKNAICFAPLVGRSLRRTFKYASVGMNLFRLVFLLGLIPAFQAVSGGTGMGDAGIDYLVIEDFQEDRVGIFPKTWKTWPFQRGDARKVYQIGEEDGNRYLKAFDDKNLSEQIFRDFHWKVEAFPYLNFRWRAHLLPKNAAENDGARNDSACGVYIVFGRAKSGRSVKLTWSTTLKEETIYVKKEGEIVMQILDSGESQLGKWRSHSINVPALYEMLFKEKLPRLPSGLGVLTDGNATQTTAACDYDDFMISRGSLH